MKHQKKQQPLSKTRNSANLFSFRNTGAPITIETVASLIVNMIILNYTTKQIIHGASKAFQIDRELVKLAFLVSSYVLEENNSESVLVAKTAASAVILKGKTVQKTHQEFVAREIAKAATSAYVESNYSSKIRKSDQLVGDEDEERDNGDNVDEEVRENDKYVCDSSTAVSNQSSKSSVAKAAVSSVTWKDKIDEKAHLKFLTAKVAKAVESAYAECEESMTTGSVPYSDLTDYETDFSDLSSSSNGSKSLKVDGNLKCGEDLVNIALGSLKVIRRKCGIALCEFICNEDIETIQHKKNQTYIMTQLRDRHSNS